MGKEKGANEIKSCAWDLLNTAIANDYISEIVEELLPDIVDDVTTSADENWNYDDVRLAIGRVLCAKLEIDCDY